MKHGVFKFIIGLGIIALTQASCVYASELTDDYFDIATNYANANNNAKALEYLEDILIIEPTNAKAQELKDKIVLLMTPIIQTPEQDKKDTVEATQVLSTVQNPENFVILKVSQADVEKMDYNSDYYNEKGLEYYQKKDYDKSIEYFYKSVKLNPRNQQAYNNMAMSYWFKGNNSVAIKYFKKAYSINNCYTQPLVNLSLLYKQLGCEKAQLETLEKAIKHNPNDYWAYYLMGDYYKGKAKFLKAIENYKEAITINQKFPQAYLSLALCYFETEEFNYALIALEQYRELNPTSDFAMLLTARTYTVLGRYDDAKKYIEKAIEINNKDEYQFELGKIDYYLEDYMSALSIFQKLTERANAAESYNYLGLCYYKIKNIDLAISNFNKAIEIDALRPIYYYNLAQCYKSLGDKKSYTKNVNTATKISPINFQDYIDLSYIYYDNGNPNYAINMLNKAISRYPNVKALYLSKLKIYESLGDNLHYNEVKDKINERFNTDETKTQKEK